MKKMKEKEKKQKQSLDPQRQRVIRLITIFPQFMIDSLPAPKTGLTLNSLRFTGLPVAHVSPPHRQPRPTVGVFSLTARGEG